MNTTNSKKSLGIVFSGGGFRGMAHIGVIKLLEELKVSPDYVAGSSAGALVGAFYAAGYGYKEILDFFKEVDLFSFRNYSFSLTGLLDPKKFAPKLEKYFPTDSFDSLTRKLFVARTNLETGEGDIISSGPLITNIMASAALPLLFSPVEIGGSLYADGGIVDNFPIESIYPFCSKILGVYVNPLEQIKKNELSNSLQILERALFVSVAHQSAPKFKLADTMIIPNKLVDHPIIDINHIEEIFEIGYQAALSLREEILLLQNA